jgi:hypothetical protein
MRPWGHDILTRIATTGKRFVVRADELLTAFLELESATGVQASQSVLNTVLLAKNHNVEAAPHH